MSAAQVEQTTQQLHSSEVGVNGGLGVPRSMVLCSTHHTIPAPGWLITAPHSRASTVDPSQVHLVRICHGPLTMASPKATMASSDAAMHEALREALDKVCGGRAGEAALPHAAIPGPASLALHPWPWVVRHQDPL